MNQYLQNKLLSTKIEKVNTGLQLKKWILLLKKKDKKEALTFLPKLSSELMKISKSGIIKKQNASRNISRITKKINSL